MSVLGVDIGTSGCRAVAFNDELAELASSEQYFDVLRSGPGHAELDPAAVLEQVAKCIRSVNSVVDADDPVTAISASALGEAVVAVDGAGEPLGTAPLSADLRGAEITAAISAKFGAVQWRELTGQPVHPMFSIGKIVQWRHTQRAWASAVRLHTFADLVLTWLGGHPVIDYSSAARTAAFDVNRREWSLDILDLAQLDRSLFPDPVPVGSRVGSVSDRRRVDLGFSLRADLFAGAHDQACAFWGGGGTTSDAVFSLGTTECLTTASIGRPTAYIDVNIASYPVDDGPEWLSLNGIPSGGSTLSWLNRLVGHTDSHVDALVASIGDGPSPVLMLPHLAGSGGVDNDPDSTGVVIGLSLTTTAADLAGALFEASGFELARSLAVAEAAGSRVMSVRVVGGGAGRAASQRRADGAGRALVLVPGPAAARGAAIVALCGSGRLPSRHGQKLAYGPVLQPRDQHWFAQRRAQFGRLYPAVQSVVSTTMQEEHS